MAYPRPARWSILVVSLIILGGEAYTLANGTLREADEWFPGALAVILACLAAVVIIVGREIHVAAVLSLLLASLSSIIWMKSAELRFSIPPFLISPFLFVHFSLIFPVPNRWIEQDPRRLSLIYIPCSVLLFPLEWQAAFYNSINPLLDFASVITFPAGFALGLSIFIYQYLAALTAAEKNRLRVILIGCLAGGAPYILVQAGRLLGSPSPWDDLAYFLVPLFPLSLVLAVLRENFYDIGRIFQQTLVGSLVTAGAIGVFFLSFLVLRLQSAESSGSTKALTAVMLALIVVYPLQHWARAYVSAHFYLAPKRPAPSSSLPGFAPIQPNPYIVGNPVQSPEMFFGRKEEFHFIKTRLHGQHEGCVILLHGERRAGKTSILHQVVNGRLGSRFVPVFVDMQGMVVESDRELLQALAAHVVEAMHAHGAAGDLPDPGAANAYLEFTSFLDASLKKLPGRQLILLIDEYELIEHKVHQGKIRAEISDYISSLLERFPKQLSLILTGSRSLEAHPAWLSLLGKSIARKISHLSPQDAADLICTPLQGRAAFDPGAIGDLLRLTRGQPFFTQLLCQTTVEMLNEQRVNYVDRSIVNHVADRVLENPPPQLLNLWNGFAAAEKLLMAAAAALLKIPESYASSDWVVRSIQSLPREHRQGLDAIKTRMVLEGLRQRDILDRDQTRYRFTMDLMRRWIRLEHSVWAVLHEIQGRS